MKLVHTVGKLLLTETYRGYRIKYRTYDGLVYFVATLQTDRGVREGRDSQDTLKAAMARAHQFARGEMH